MKARFVCISVACFVAVVAAHWAAADAQDQLFAELLSPDDGASARALLALTATAEAVEANTPTLLGMREQLEGEYDLYLYYDLFKGTSLTGSRAGVVLLRITDAIRTLLEVKHGSSAFMALRQVVDKALSSPSQEETPPLDALFRSVFEQRPQLVPADTKAAAEVIAVLIRALESDSPSTHSKAAHLLTMAASLLPERRQELVDIILRNKRATDMDDVEGIIMRFTREGEPLRIEDVAAAQERSIEQLIQDIKWLNILSPRWALYMQQLMSAVEKSPNRDRYVLALLSDPDPPPRLRHLNVFLPAPLPLDASESDRALIDAVIEKLREPIVAPVPEERGRDWGFRGLSYLASRPNRTLESRVLRNGEIREFHVYGQDRVVDILVEALQIDNGDVQSAAARALERIAWTRMDLARKALAALESTTLSATADPVRYQQSGQEAEMRLNSRKDILERATDNVRRAVAAFEAMERPPELVPIIRVPSK